MSDKPLYNPDDPKDISHPDNPAHWIYLQGEQGRAAQREREERQKLLAGLKVVPDLPKAVAQVLAGAAPTEQQSPEAFDRWAETYGLVVAELKRSGSAKVPSEGSGVNAKTLSEHLRAIRRAIKLFHYKSPLIDDTFDMEAYSFIAVNKWVYVQSRTNRARTEVLSAAPPAMPLLLVQTLEELTAVAVVFNLREGNRARSSAFSYIKVYMPDVDLIADLHRLFVGCRIRSEMDVSEIERSTGGGEAPK